MNNRRAATLAVLSLFFVHVAPAQTTTWVSAYYGGWTSSHLPPDSIDFSAFTHLIHFAIYPNGGPTFDGTQNGLTPDHMVQTVQAAHRAGKKILLSVSGDLREAVSPENRTASIQNLIAFMQTYGYDGIDIDWEPVTDGVNFAPWIRDLHTAMTSQNGSSILTAAALAFDQAIVDNAVVFDQVNLMTYDMAGPWPGWVTWHNAPIYDGGYRFPSTGGLITSANGSVDQYITAGVPKAKLGIGADFLGYYWMGGDGTPTGGVTAPRQSYTVTPYVRGNVQYYEIMDTYEGYPVLWDSSAQAAYISIDNPGSADDRFISFDNERTMYAKAAYVREKGIGGVIVFELGAGYRANQPPGQKDLLLQAAKRGFMLGEPYVPDNIRPTVALVSPAQGESVTGTITLSANAIDNSGIVFVQFLLDNAAYRDPIKVPPFSLPLNTWKLTNGTHRITALARDRGGNIDSAWAVVTVANTGTPPRIPPLLVFDESLHPPFQNSSWGSHVFLDNVDVVRSGSIAVRVEFVDWGALDFHSGPMQSGVPIDPLVYDTLQFDVYPLHTFPLTIGFYNGTTVETTITAGTWNHLIVPLRFFGTFDRFYMQRNLSGGDVAFFDNVTLTGFGGAPPTPPRTPDAVRPQVTLLSPQPGAVVHDLASVAVSAVDNIGVAGVQFKVDGAPFGNEDLRPPYETSVNTWYLKNGTHTFSAVARDGSGNRDSASASVTVSNSGTPPNFDLFVFDDALQPPFQNENWGATFTAVTSPVRSGTHSARIDFLTGWGAWDMISGAWGDLIPISPADYDSIALDVYPTSDFALDIGFYRSYNPSFLLTANTWNHISAPLLVDTLITRFWFRKNSAGAATAYFDNVRFVAKSTDKTDGTPAPPLPLEFSLEQNFPNPFNPATSISFSLPRPVQVKLTVFDLLGREVVTLADGPYGAGTYTVRFDPSATGRMASGVYFYRLEAGDFSETRRMVMIR